MVLHLLPYDPDDRYVIELEDGRCFEKRTSGGLLHAVERFARENLGEAAVGWRLDVRSHQEPCVHVVCFGGGVHFAAFLRRDFQQLVAASVEGERSRRTAALVGCVS